MLLKHFSLFLKHQQKYLSLQKTTKSRTLIWGLTHCLPQTMLQNCTFSTYEADPSEATTRIIGTCLPAEKVRHTAKTRGRALLSVDDYTGQYVTLNCYTGLQSPLTHQNSMLFPVRSICSHKSAQTEHENTVLRELLASAEDSVLVPQESYSLSTNFLSSEISYRVYHNKKYLICLITMPWQSSICV